MLIIGLTGPSGAGKGTVADLFVPYGVPSIDTDRVYHDLLIPPSACLDDLAAHFGKDILCTDGTLNRLALAARVFAPGHEDDLAALNRITHAYVLDCTRGICHELADRGCPAVLVDAPLLFESGFDKECDRTLAVLADRSVRMARIMTRDGLDTEAATARLDAQKPDDFYIARADAVIINDTTPDAPAEAVHSLLCSWGVIAP